MTPDKQCSSIRMVALTFNRKAGGGGNRVVWGGVGGSEESSHADEKEG